MKQGFRKINIGILIFLAGISKSFSDGCTGRDYGNGGVVCVCNSDSCDTLPEPPQVENNTFIKYTSNQAGLRFEQKIGKIKDHQHYSLNQIEIEHEDYQEILGFGGAFTDATCNSTSSLTEELQDKILRAYFSEEGIGYSLGRVPMGSTDFSTHPYTYDEEEDVTLSKFALASEDLAYRIPIIHKAQELTKKKLNLITSTWAAPKWIKTNGEYGGKGFIKEDMYQVWANYFLKYLDEYEKQNITFWGITTSNEPSLAFIASNIPSIAWHAQQMTTWISNNLGPTIRNSTHSAIKILIVDDQRFFLPWLADDILNGTTADEYVDGVAVHYYYDNIISPQVLTETHERHPDKFILATEATTGNAETPHVLLGSWSRAERYATSIIDDMNNWVIGWIEWNLSLNLLGGPAYLGNYADSPIIVNDTAGEFYKQPTYYAAGHFAKFVPRGSVKIYASKVDGDVPVVAFRRPDDRIAVVLLNMKDITYPVLIKDERIGHLHLELSARSITTVLYYYADPFTSLSTKLQPKLVLIIGLMIIKLISSLTA